MWISGVLGCTSVRTRAQLTVQHIIFTMHPPFFFYPLPFFLWAATCHIILWFHRRHRPYPVTSSYKHPSYGVCFFYATDSYFFLLFSSPFLVQEAFRQVVRQVIKHDKQAGLEAAAAAYYRATKITFSLLFGGCYL